MRCLFCEKSETLTLEHVLPNWLTELYPNKTTVTNEFTGDNPKTWQSRIFQHKARVVCSKCNNGWMAKLEGAAKPIIKDMISLNSMKLDEVTQGIIAFWAQKTTLMLNQSVPGGVKITHDIYKDIFIKKNYSTKVLVNLGWRMMLKGNKDQPIASFEIKQIQSVKVDKHIMAKIGEEIAQGLVWKAVLAVGPVVFELIGHNMNVTLEVASNTRVFSTIRPYFKEFLWPLEWPIEAEGGLAHIKTRN